MLKSDVKEAPICPFSLKKSVILQAKLKITALLIPALNLPTKKRILFYAGGMLRHIWI